MRHIYNFSAGPSVLPEPVLQEAADEMMNYRGSGMSVMEISHRSALFQSIIDEAEYDLRTLMNIPDDYEVLFLQGGTSLQFAMIPMNFMRSQKADYILTGHWAKKASEEASIYGKVHVAASSEDKNFSYIPECDDLDILPDSDYVYMCENNTIYGTKFHKRPNTQGKILINDISSSFLSEPMDVSKYGMLFGGIQKNLGPAGLVIAIIRKDLISDTVLPWTPTMLRYKTHADKKSLYNTPPTYNIYIVGKVIKWIQSLGGLEKMKEINEKKAAALYDFLDGSSLFHGTVRKDSRSLMNVTFRTSSDEMDAAFIKAAEKQEIVSIKGHRAVGGMRASIYNAMPMDGVLRLIDFMTAFEENRISDCSL